MNVLIGVRVHFRLQVRYGSCQIRKRNGWQLILLCQTKNDVKQLKENAKIEIYLKSYVVLVKGKLEEYELRQLCFHESVYAALLRI